MFSAMGTVATLMDRRCEEEHADVRIKFPLQTLSDSVNSARGDSVVVVVAAHLSGPLDVQVYESLAVALR